MGFVLRSGGWWSVYRVRRTTTRHGSRLVGWGIFPGWRMVGVIFPSKTSTGYFYRLYFDISALFQIEIKVEIFQLRNLHPATLATTSPAGCPAARTRGRAAGFGAGGTALGGRKNCAPAAQATAQSRAASIDAQLALREPFESGVSLAT